MRAWNVFLLVSLINLAIFASKSPVLGLLAAAAVLMAFFIGRDYQDRKENP